MKHLICRGSTALALVLTAGSVTPRGGTPASVVLNVEGRANVNASVAAYGQVVAVVWAAVAEGSATDIYAALSRDAGVTFGRPERVNDTPGDAHVSGEQPPRISLLPR